MTEQEIQKTFPLSFDIIEAETTKPAKINTYIGNSGGIYVWKEGEDYFEQHFTPDGSWKPAENPKSQRKHVTLYPAVLWHFLRWQDELPDQDPRKQIATIRGVTNAAMSNFRSKLLRDVYSFQKVNDNDDPSLKTFDYSINLTKLRANQALMEKLEKFAERTERMGYTTITPMTKPEKMDEVIITKADLAK